MELSPERKKRWKHCFFLFLVTAAVLHLTAGGYIFWFYRIRQIPTSPNVDYIRSLLRNGDIILRSGIGFWSGLFRSSNTTDKRFSHVGIVRIRQDGSIRVIHAEGDDISGKGKVFEDTLEHFVGESDKIGLGRLRLGEPDRFVEYAMTFLGRPFDWKFDKSDDSSIYCTELVDLSLRKLNSSFRLPERKGLLLPEACLSPDYFIEIPVLQ